MKTTREAKPEGDPTAKVRYEVRLDSDDVALIGIAASATFQSPSEVVAQAIRAYHRTVKPEVDRIQARAS